MKICHVTSAHKRYDGRIFLKQCTSLAKKYDTFLICCDLLDDEEKNNVKILSTKKVFKNRYDRMINAKRVLKPFCLKVDADLYQFHDPELLGLALYMKRKGKKVIFDSHEDNASLFLEKDWIPKILRNTLNNVYINYEKKVFKKLDGVICVSNSVLERSKSFTDNIIIIENFPILDDNFKKISKNEKILNLCFAGGVNSGWNHNIIVEAIQNIDNIHYTIAGPITEEYKNYLLELDVNKKITILGKISFNEVKNLYSKSDVGMALCSYRPNTNYKVGSLSNTKIFEYMMYELPSIFTNFKVYSEINTKKEFGIPVTPSSITEVKKAIGNMRENKDLRNKMIKNGKELVKSEYNWSILETRLYNFYSKVEKR